MKEANNTLAELIIKMLDKWGSKTWFKVIAVVILFYFMLVPVATPIITHYIQKIDMPQQITEALDDRDAQKNRQHKANFEASRQAYALAKHTMQEFVPLTKSEYIFLLEFHNGSENVMTGIQFCRFDMTLEVAAGQSQYVPIEKFKDDIVARYDILLSDEMTKNKVQYYTQEQFEKVDRYLAYQMTYVQAKAYAVVSLKDRDGKIFGAVLCITNNDTNMDLLAVRELAINLEDIFTPMD